MRGGGHRHGGARVSKPWKRRRRCLPRLGTLLLVLALAAGAVPRAARADAAEDEAVRAIDRALVFLARKQQADGAIHTGSNKTAMTGLALMAFMAAGHMPIDRTPEGETIRRGLDYVLAEERQKNGYFGEDGSRMYGHGIVTLMLAEALGMGSTPEQDERIRRRLEPAVALILRAQRAKPATDRQNHGGWRYLPTARDSDLSVTAWQLLALRAAQNAAVEVPAAAIEAAVRYVRVCAGGRGFRYQPSGGPTYTSASYGLLAMQACGQYAAPEVVAAAEWLDGQEVRPSERNFFYGTYYYAQGMHQRGGELAERARRRVVEALLAMQGEDGSWVSKESSERSAGPVYSTAMAVLSLSVRYHYLPIYQR